MKSPLGRILIATLGLIACALAAWLVCALLPGLGGHDRHLRSAVMVGLITIFGQVMRRKAEWQFWEFIAGVLPVLFVVLPVVVVFGSLRIPTAPILVRGIFESSLFVLPPWLLGYGVGSISLIAARTQRPIHQHSWTLAAVYAVCGISSSAFLGFLANYYGNIGMPLPRITLSLLRLGPNGWLFVTFAMAALIIWKDLALNPRLGNAIFSACLLLALGTLFLPLIEIFSQSSTP